MIVHLINDSNETFCNELNTKGLVYLITIICLNIKTLRYQVSYLVLKKFRRWKPWYNINTLNETNMTPSIYKKLFRNASLMSATFKQLMPKLLLRKCDVALPEITDWYRHFCDLYKIHSPIWPVRRLYFTLCRHTLCGQVL